MENKYENVVWVKAKNKYKGSFEVGGKRYGAGYSKDPYECYLKTQAKKEQIQKEYWESLVNLSDPGEIWKDIPLCEGKFLLSNYGRVKSLSSAKAGIISNGKSRLVLVTNNGTTIKFNITSWVVKLFLELDPKEYVITHIDGDKTNCNVSNLSLQLKAETKNQKYLEMVEKAKGVKHIIVDKRNPCFRGEFEFECNTYRFSSSNLADIIEKVTAAKEKIFQENNMLLGELLPNEEFKEVRDTEGLYQISNKGRLIKLDTPFKLLVPGSISKGYLIYRINSKNVKAHQLVAQEFLGHTINGHSSVIDHINHDTLDNSVENLQIISNRENSSKKKVKKHNLPMGVLNTKSGKFMAVTQRMGKKVYLGRFITPEEAHQAYLEYWKTVEG